MDSSYKAIVRADEGLASVITENTITDDNDGGSGTDAQGFHVLVMSLEVFWSQPLPPSGIVTVGRSSKCEVQVEDPMASREHLRIHVGSSGGVPVLTVEDNGSANGTRVRDAEIKPGEPAAIMPGESIVIGSTVLMVLQDRPTAGHRRLWSHARFETRVDEECARAAKTRAAFSMARLRFTGAAPWNRVMPVLAREMTTPHVFASYGPKDYEILFIDLKPGEPEALVQTLIDVFRTAGLEAQGAVVWYPKDGRTADSLLASANASLKAATGRKVSTGEAISPDASGMQMQRVRAMATRAASSNINVLILGESGVGKDVLARLIHQMSPRAAKPFVALNCASLTETLMESELFGHDKSAFTGATVAKVGLFESANGGTVFLDEIGEMPPPMQAKLLSAIEQREVRPVGAVRSRPIDVRFLSATNINIEAAVEKGTFRRDLMYRLNTLTLQIPPLRERQDEIPALVQLFVTQCCKEAARETLSVSLQAMECMVGYEWPGNIRELKNTIERAVVLCEGPEILLEHLPLEKMRPESGDFVPLTQSGKIAMPAAGRLAMNLPPLTNPDEIAERGKILDALEAHVWSQTRAAAHLGMSRRTFVSKLDRYGIPRPQKRREDEGEKTRIGQKVLIAPEHPADEPRTDPARTGS